MTARARVAPPPLVTEQRPSAPSPRHVWVPGYWTWRHNRHIWMTGAWTVPPAANQIWIEPRWAHEGSEWVFYPGRWQAAAVVAPPPLPMSRPVIVAPPPAPLAGEVYVESAPPAPQAETPPAMPGPNVLWDAGHWEWQGRWKWVPGHWESRRPGLFYTPAHWEQRGHHYKFVPARWHR